MLPAICILLFIKRKKTGNRANYGEYQKENVIRKMFQGDGCSGIWFYCQEEKYDSILDSLYHDFELILINDGSEDRSLESDGRDFSEWRA